MSVAVVTEAGTSNLTTVSAVKGTLGVSSRKFDAEIDRLISAATSAIEQYVRHVYSKQTYDETVTGTSHTLLLLTNTPIVSVSAIVCQSSPITDYSIRDAEAGILYRQAGWASGEWVGWAASGGRPIMGSAPEEMLYTVTYVAGYDLPGTADANLPAYIEQACIETVVDWYRSAKRDDAVKSKTVGDLAITYKSPTAVQAIVEHRLPAGARALLSRRVR